VRPFAISGSFCRRVGVDVGRVAAGFEQREVHRVLASQKGTAGQAAAVTDDPKTLPVAFDVEVIRQGDTCRDEIGHGDLPGLLRDPQ
jgi:hypothetical protein